MAGGKRTTEMVVVSSRKTQGLSSHMLARQPFEGTELFLSPSEKAQEVHSD